MPSDRTEPVRRVCVTGAASGIGRAAADRFLAHGHDVVLADRDETALADAVDQLAGKYSGRVSARTVEVSVGEEVESLVKHLGGHGGPGHADPGRGRHERRVHRRHVGPRLGLHPGHELNGAFHCLKHATPLLRDSTAASVVAVGSVSAHVIRAGGGCAAYEVSKAGLVQLVRAFAVEQAPFGIRANIVSPGRIATRLGEHARQLAATVYTSAEGPRRVRHPFTAPLRHEGLPEEVAGVIHFLAGADAGYITGAELLVDGGYTAM